jgi:hypothetical protein
MRRDFGVDARENDVDQIQADGELAPRNPLDEAYRRAPELVTKWRKTAYQQIRRSAHAEGARIFFEHAADVGTAHHDGAGWKLTESGLTVDTTGKMKGIRTVSAVTPKGDQAHSWIYDGEISADIFIDFLKTLLRSMDGKIFLIVSSDPVHRANSVRDFTEQETGGRLRLFFLPPDWPESAPDESAPEPVEPILDKINGTWMKRKEY